MAYTPPNDLFTNEEAILSLASSIADEDRMNLGNGTINGALDVLADALAERNVEVPPMNAGAILALAQYVTGGGGGGSATQTLTVTKSDESDTVSVTTMSWADYIAENYDGAVEVQPDSTDGLVSVYSIPVGATFYAAINNSPVRISLNAEMTVNINLSVMPSTPLYAIPSA